ncbi:helix-turn-helix domain-containing protein [Skermanella mucosa]|uniref:helix-turn-helix domain-containing protein n=1 Tax=Skermanella mucosa TaxID=1789672 RepID=UPI00192BA856|nr:helix-turn-helix transcriptional regulator [Skermanella mucosa]UEM23062.1 helix-turn-helix domain-containing protein [Skermanella mucosa]
MHDDLGISHNHHHNASKTGNVSRSMPNNFTLPPALLRELGYLINDGQRRGWADRVAQMIRVNPRTVEAWARGERECEGPSAVLIAHLARMTANGTYTDISLDEVAKIIASHGIKSSIDLDDPGTRTKIRSVIKLTSSIKKVAEDLGINRPALSRWLSGESALSFDLASKVLSFLGLNRSMETPYEATWHVNLNDDPSDEFLQDIRDAIALFFPELPDCIVSQTDMRSERHTTFSVKLSRQQTTISIDIRAANKLVRNVDILQKLFSAFDGVSTFTFYCPVECQKD